MDDDEKLKALALDCKLCCPAPVVLLVLLLPPPKENVEFALLSPNGDDADAVFDEAPKIGVADAPIPPPKTEFDCCPCCC